MRVFISWSGDQSRHIAQALRDWLPDVLQAVKPWMSDTDIESGQKWQPELSKQLDECKFGIVCVTPENQAKPWLNFEAGALSKALGSVTFVCPYLYEMEPEGLTGPLSQFQSRKADKEDTRQLVYNINGRLDENDKLSQAQVEKAFGRWWEELKKNLTNCPSEQVSSPAIGPLDLIPEILENTRALRRELVPKLGMFEQADVDWGFASPPMSARNLLEKIVRDDPMLARNLLEKLVRDGGHTQNLLEKLIEVAQQNAKKGRTDPSDN
jgi:hypothetical protein